MCSPKGLPGRNLGSAADCNPVHALRLSYTSMCCPQRVEERLVCHAVIGTQGGKTLIMSVKVTCEFIAPLLQLSTKHVTYRLEKVSGAACGVYPIPSTLSPCFFML